eukprot:49342-Eustigmatos_ZCMA.PRE.1
MEFVFLCVYLCVDSPLNHLPHHVVHAGRRRSCTRTPSAASCAGSDEVALAWMSAVCHVPLQDIPKEHLRKNIAYVPQDAVLFSGSVKENLFLGFNDLDNRPVRASGGRSVAFAWLLP